MGTNKSRNHILITYSIPIPFCQHFLYLLQNKYQLNKELTEIERVQGHIFGQTMNLFPASFSGPWSFMEVPL